jgi:hypothetical protein
VGCGREAECIGNASQVQTAAPLPLLASKRMVWYGNEFGGSYELYLGKDYGNVLHPPLPGELRWSLCRRSINP